MTTCMPTVTDLGRADRAHITWDTTGLNPDTDQAFIRIEGGPRKTLTVGDGQVVGFFAGPDYPNPAPAIVVPGTSYTEIVVVTTLETLTFSGGFIRLVS